MNHNTEGKRALPGSGMPRGGKIGLILVCLLLVLAVGGYLGLCAYVGAKGTVLPNTSASVGGDLSGMTREEAAQAIRSAAQREYAAKMLHISCGNFSTDLTGSFAQAAADAAADAAYAHGREHGFLGQGAAWLSAHWGGTTVNVDTQLSPDGEKALERLSQEIESTLASPLVETTYKVDHDALVLHKGSTGMSVDAAELKSVLLDALRDGKDSVELAPHSTAPAEPDFEALYREVYKEPADAYLNKETKEIVPSVTGVSFDIAAARALLERTDEGSSVSVPLSLAVPDVTTELLHANLFKDVLGKSTTKAGGPNARWHNIALACSFINDVILLPGEVFSYTAYCGPYSAEKGYQKAGAYVSGKTVDTTAGGICQLSSTLYWTTLKANLETVERKNHKYDVGYLPTGLDATVYGESPDFRFKNNTEYPIKLTASLTKGNDGKRYCSVAIYGTNTTGIHGEPYSILLETISAKIVYEPNDAKVAQGSAPVKDPERTLYNGKRVEVHQKLVAADGSKISDTVIHSDRYSPRDGVYFYNSADAALWGINPSTGLRTEPPVTPSPSPTPVPTGTPSPSDPPVSTESPSPTPGGETPPEGIPIATPSPSAPETPSESVPLD